MTLGFQGIWENKSLEGNQVLYTSVDVSHVSAVAMVSFCWLQFLVRGGNVNSVHYNVCVFPVLARLLDGTLWAWLNHRFPPLIMKVEIMTSFQSIADLQSRS